MCRQSKVSRAKKVKVVVVNSSVTKVRFNRLIFRPKEWNWFFKVCALVGVLAFAAFLFYYLSLQFDTYPCFWFCATVILTEAILAWYMLDAFVSRQTLFSWFNDTEQPIKLEIRFFRKILLLVVILLGVVTFGNEANIRDGHTTSEGLSRIFGGSRNVVLVLAGIFIATFGWMYTNFQKEKSDRISNTLSGVHQQIYGQNFVALIQQLVVLVRHARASGFDRNGILVAKSFDLNLAELSSENQSESSENVTLGSLVNRLLNALDQIAYGVRVGYYDFHTVEMVFRQRYIRRTYEFLEFIKKGTEATFDERSGQYRANNRTWEHCLWLVDQLPIIESDQIPPENRKFFVLPPKNG